MPQFIQFMRVRRYSSRTIKAYTSLVGTEILGKCALASVRDENLTRYMNKLASPTKMPTHLINSDFNIYIICQ